MPGMHIFQEIDICIEHLQNEKEKYYAESKKVTKLYLI